MFLYSLVVDDHGQFSRSQRVDCNKRKKHLSIFILGNVYPREVVLKTWGKVFLDMDLLPANTVLYAHLSFKIKPVIKM